MLKLYLKKLFTIIATTAALAVIAVLILAVFGFILRLDIYNPNLTLESAVLVAICLIIAGIATYKSRIVDAHKIKTIDFKSFIIQVLKSKDNIAIMLAWQTIIIVLNIFLAISNNTPATPLIFGVLIIVLLSSVIIELFNLIIWSVVFLKSKSL